MKNTRLADQLASGDLSPDDLPELDGGDYCSAHEIGEAFLLLVGRTAEASNALSRAAAMLPMLEQRVSLAIPSNAATGHLPDGRSFLITRRLSGVPLSRSLFKTMTAKRVHAAAQALAAFLADLHATPRELTESAGIPVAWYPFAATEDGMADGPSAPHYANDLSRIEQHGLVAQSTLDRLHALTEAQMARESDRQSEPVLLHGEVSADHVFVNPDDLTVTGIIDFQGLVLGDPVRDLMYIADDFGVEFAEQVARAYPHPRLADPLPTLGFYSVWHIVVRMLWGAEHGYAERAAMLAQQLEATVAADTH
ncbi:MAG: phosphotransferase [Thermomicrobiales bacterium]|nr:phosphotransferase [Thermomicrobiales bacterium]